MYDCKVDFFYLYTKSKIEYILIRSMLIKKEYDFLLIIFMVHVSWILTLIKLR